MNRTKHSNENLESLKKSYNVIGVVHTSVKTKDSLYSGKPIVLTNPDSNVSEDYRNIADYIRNYKF